MHLEHLPGHRVSAREHRRRGASLVGEPEGERRAHPFDQLIGKHRRHDLTTQAVLLHPLGVAVRQGGGEVSLQVFEQVLVVGQVGLEQPPVQVDLAVGHHDGQLRRDQSAMVGLAVRDLVLAGQELELALEPGHLLQAADQPRVDIDHPRCLQAIDAERLRLRVGAVAHLFGDRVSHLGEQLVSLVHLHVAVCDQPVEQDLDVHLVVGGVDPSDVVDRIGVDPPAATVRAAGDRVLDPPPLAEAQVPPLPHDLAPELSSVDAQRVVRLVVHVGVGLVRGLHVRADPSVPQQVDRRTEDRPDQLGRRHLLGLDPQRLGRLGADRDRLSVPLVHAAALRQCVPVVVRPRGALELEQALSLGEARLGVGIGIEEHVLVVEGGH